ncbi:phage terminase large subunit [Limisalsivibrio acetivorans]|uniref:phage terminase large subunit n=1 Tax=Limisalsivibrio acetivorans TaxID=1304888 RepID=UPI0003B53DFC|nr:phage terminase large subunit [Limisalsivibrio acetivorans]
MITKNDPKIRALLKGRSSLTAYSMLSFPRFAPSWHHKVLATELERVERGETDRLMVMMPPRHGKSELASVRFPAWFLGRKPEARIIACSYSAELAEHFSRRVRDVLDSSRSRLVFPGVHPRRGFSSAGKWETEGGGAYVSSGVGGSITGLGGDLIIIDDPVKNSEQAESSAYREKVWEWYQSTLFTRLEKGGRIILIQTRWHEDDLAGRLLSSGDDEWRVVSFPAVAEVDEEYRKAGEPLWKEKYGAEDLGRIRKSVGERVWNALYQQSPSPQEGSVFRREWWQYYRTLPARIDFFAQSWDMSFKGGERSDYVVGQVWAASGSSRYLVDMVRARMDFAETLRAVRRMTEKYPKAEAKYIEDKANGSAVISALGREISGLIPVQPLGSKTSRAYVVQPLLEAGNVWLPEKGEWVQSLVEEAAAFPDGANDDMVDAMTQALNFMAKRQAPAGFSSGAVRSSAGLMKGY